MTGERPAPPDYLRDRVVAAIGTHYLVEHEIGRGGSGVVYRATDLRLNRPVAIKVLPPELAYNADVRTRFVREAQTAAQLSHPHIVPIFSVDEHDGIVYFVMALIEGESVAGSLARESRWPVDRTARTLREVADALSYAHSRGVVHRDIKPDNILIDRASGRALVTDFGIARAAAGDARLTVTGATVGTPAYMSPEQALGERELDGRSDIYSLGAVGYEMLVGETPFRATSATGMLLKHVRDTPAPVRERRPDVPAYLGIIIDRSLEKQPENRWSSAGELRDMLSGATAVVERPRVAPAPEPALQPPPLPGSFQAPQTEPLDEFRRQWGIPPLSGPFQAPQSLPPWQQPLTGQPPWVPRVEPPPGLSRGQLKRWYRDQYRQGQRQMVESMKAEGRHAMLEAARDRVFHRPLWKRVVAYQRSVLTFAVVAPALLVINLATSNASGGPWFLFPDGILLLIALRRAGSLWAEGIGPWEALQKGLVPKLRGMASGAQLQPGPSQLAGSAPGPSAYSVQAGRVQSAASLVPPEVLAGAYGEPVRRAVADRAVILDIAARLTGLEKDMLPDVAPTVEGLTSRVASIATTLHRLDADVSGASLGSLDERIVALKRETETKDRERRLTLLERQRLSLHDLLERRRTLANQLESASIALQNLKLDLLKLRSAGVDAAIHDSTSATQEARAVSRDISRLIEVADELRKI